MSWEQWLNVGSAAIGGVGLAAAAWQIFKARKDVARLVSIQESRSLSAIFTGPSELDPSVTG
jgi:hypothetical protein